LYRPEGSDHAVRVRRRDGLHLLRRPVRGTLARRVLDDRSVCHDAMSFVRIGASVPPRTLFAGIPA
jgi:hypothetical protein